MKKLPVLLLVAALLSGAAFAASTTDPKAGTSATPTGDVAQRLTAKSLKQDVSEDDPRVAQTRKLLDKAVKLTREEPMAVAAACSRYAGHLFDAIHEAATALELLEALATFGKSGQAMNDTLQRYASARKAAPTKSHDQAMTVLRGQQ